MSHTPMTFEQTINMINDHFATALNRLPEAQSVLRNHLDTNIAETPFTIIHEDDRVKLKHYKPMVKSQYKTPLFIVYALINRETMLDLQPDRSIIRQLLKSGIDLYVLDWGNPTRKDKFLNIDDHVNGFIDNAVDVILEKTGVDQLNLMGICMGGTFSAIYASLHPEKVKNLILTVAPTSFDTDAGLLHTWWGHEQFDVDQFVDMNGNVPGDILNAHFLMLNPAKLIIDKYVGFLKNMHKKGAVENFIRMEKWIFDSPDVPGETFREFIKYFYKENRFIQNELTIGGEHVDLNRITMPVLNVYCQYDHLVPPEACNQFIHKIGSPDGRDICLKTGHIGIFVSSKARNEFVPSIVSWLKERDEAFLSWRTNKPERPFRVEPKRSIAADNRRANTFRFRRA